MKRFIVSVLLSALVLICAAPSYAALPERKIKNPPQGTFKKAKDGTIIQYDANGKVIGKYKLESGTYKKQ